MARNLAVAGKGGTGKTTLAALLVRYLLERGKRSVLAVDADPNSNLHEALGVKVEHTIAECLAETKSPRALPAGMNRNQYVEYRLNQAIASHGGFDLLVMGNPEGPGCYCYPNSLLQGHLERLVRAYEYLVLDNEAGLEHLSRRVSQDVQVMLVTSDATVRGIRSAGRIRPIVDSVRLKVDRMHLVVTRTRGCEDLEVLRPEIERAGLPLAGTIPHDPLVTEFDLQGKPLFLLPDDSPAWQATREMLDRLDGIVA